jgi:hypothetical protein
MGDKRFEMIITDTDGSFHYLDKNTGEKITSTLELENKLNALHEEKERVKQDLKEFKVYTSNRISGAVVTNDDYSVTLCKSNEANMVCNMINCFIRSVKE